MRITRLQLANWRGVGQSDVAFGDGVTLVTGRNEVGKSSLIEALTHLVRYPDNSSHKDVKAVHPVHVDAAPTITLEADLDGTRITYEKRFKKTGQAGATSLRIETPGRAPVTETGREAHDRAEALLREHMDLELWQALQIEQGKEIAQASLKDRRGLQAALDSAAGSDAGLGSEDSALIERVTDEYGRFYTAKGKPRARLGALPGEIEALESEVREAQSRLDQISATTDRHADLERRRDGMRKHTSGLEQQARDAAARWATVEKLSDQVEQARLALQNAQLSREQVAARVGARRELAASIAELTNAVERDKEAVAQQSRQLEELRRQADSAGRAVDDTNATLKNIRSRHQQVRSAIERERSQVDARAVADRLKRLATLDEALRDAQATVDAIELTDGVVAALRQLIDEIVHLEAAVQSVSPDIEIEALQAVDLELRGAAMKLEAGTRHTESVNNGFAMSLPGLLNLRVATTRNIAERLKELEEARGRLAASLQEHGVRSIAEAEQKLAEKRQAETLVQTLGGRREELLGVESEQDLRGLQTRLASRIERLDEALAGVDMPGDAGELARLDEQEAAREQELAAKLEQLELTNRQMQDQLGALREHLASSKSSLESAQDRLEHDESTLAQERATEDDEALARATVDGEAAVNAAEKAYADQQSALEQANPEQARLLAGNSQDTLQRHKQDINQLDLDIREAEGELAQARREGLSERLDTLETHLTHKQDEYRRVQRQAAAVARLFDVLMKHRDDASRAYVQPLRDHINQLGRLVFNPSFAIEIDNDLTIENRTLDGVTVPFDSLSVGAREQIGILARLAAAQLVEKEGQVPLLLDDSLGYADESRLQTMGAAIAKVGRNTQIIILTCMPERFTHVGNATTVSLG